MMDFIELVNMTKSLLCFLVLVHHLLLPFLGLMHLYLFAMHSLLYCFSTFSNYIFKAIVMFQDAKMGWSELSSALSNAVVDGLRFTSCFTSFIVFDKQDHQYIFSGFLNVYIWISHLIIIIFFIVIVFLSVS